MTDFLSAIPVWLAVAAAAALLVLVLKKTVKWFFKLLWNTCIGFALLWLVNFFGSPAGIHVDFSPLTAAITAVFGVPGVAAILLWNWVVL